MSKVSKLAELLQSLPGRNEFNYWIEQGDEAIEAGRNTTGKAVAVLDKVYLDPQNRGKGIGRDLMRIGLDDMAQNHPGMDVQLLAEPLDDATNLDDLVRLYESSGFSLGDYKEGMSGVPMEMRLPGKPTNTASIQSAAPIGAGALLAGTALAPEDAEAAIQREQYLRDQSEATAAAQSFAQRRASKTNYWKQRRDEVLEFVDRLGDAAMLTLDMPLRGYMGLSGAAGALAAGQGWDNAIQRGARVALQPTDATAYQYGQTVTDQLTPYVPPEVAASAGALVNAGSLLGSPL